MYLIPLIIVLGLVFTVLVMSLRNILKQNVVSATSHLGEMASEYAKKEEEIKKQLEEVKRQSQDSIVNAQKDAQQEKERIIKEAQDTKGKLLDQAQKKIDEMIQQADRSRQALIADAEQKIEDRSVVRAAELLKQAMPDDMRRQIHEYWLKSLTTSTFSQLDRLHIPENENEARVVSAFSLSIEQRDDLKAKIKEKLGREFTIKDEVDADIIAGLVVHIGSLVLDGSFKSRIQEVVLARKISST
ncbi:hypothetical protein EPO66_02485 [bacterium]|nr:MAG: hypothetical protein EPO66_02485 [bacterium]